MWERRTRNPYPGRRVTDRWMAISHRQDGRPQAPWNLLILLRILVSASRWNYPVDPVSDGVGLAGFKKRANAFSLAQLLALTLYSSACSSFILWVGIVELGSS